MTTTIPSGRTQLLAALRTATKKRTQRAGASLAGTGFTCIRMLPLVMFSFSAFGQGSPVLNQKSQAAVNPQAYLLSGQQLFASTCAVCHADSLSTTAPKLSALRQMTTRGIYAALTKGKMSTQAASLTNEQRQAVAKWIKGQPLKETVLPDWAFTSFSLPRKAAVLSGWGVITRALV
jgi:mono/diheme cytochrome c family protein